MHFLLSAVHLTSTLRDCSVCTLLAVVSCINITVFNVSIFKDKPSGGLKFRVYFITFAAFYIGLAWGGGLSLNVALNNL